MRRTAILGTCLAAGLLANHPVAHDSTAVCSRRPLKGLEPAPGDAAAPPVSTGSGSSDADARDVGRSAQADPVSDALVRVEEAWALAVQRGDVGALQRIIGDDYVGTTATGHRQDKQSYLDEFVSGDRKTWLLTTESVEVRVYGSTAVVMHGGRAEGELRGTRTAGSFRWTHVFVNRDGRWQAVVNHVTRLQGGQQR